MGGAARFDKASNASAATSSLVAAKRSDNSSTELKTDLLVALRSRFDKNRRMERRECVTLDGMERVEARETALSSLFGDVILSPAVEDLLTDLFLEDRGMRRMEG